MITLDEDNRHTDNLDWYTGSAFSYAGRMRLKAILRAVFPDQSDFDQAWEAVRQTFLQEIHEGHEMPGFSRWIAHRDFGGSLWSAGQYGMTIDIGPTNFAGGYHTGLRMTQPMRSYMFLGKTAEEAFVGFEFDKW